MPGKRIFGIVAATVPALLPNFAHACMLFPQPFRQSVARAGAQTLAIRATPTLRYSTRTDEHWAGEIAFDDVRCLKRPRGMRCPTRLQITFSEHFDGASCPSVLYEDPRPGRNSQLRYFLLHRDSAGDWRLSLAARRFDR